MGLEFDNLKNNDTCIIVCNTTGALAPFYDWYSLLKQLDKTFGIDPKYIMEYFSKEEITHFFLKNGLDKITWSEIE